MNDFPVHRHAISGPADRCRGNMIGRALWLTDWLRQQRLPFTARRLAEEMETSYRTALRWLEVAEGVGLVDCDRSKSCWHWTSNVIN